MDRPVRICFDRIIGAAHKLHAARAAISENPHNAPREEAVRALLPPGASLHPLKMALLAGKRWAPGRTLTVRFLDGSPIQRRKAQENAERWLAYANVGLRFSQRGRAEIRVSFAADPGSWSAVGTDCLSEPDFPRTAPTLNLGWLRDDTDDVEWRRVAVHEFGHALGAIHEHQNPRGGIRWKLAAVYRYFSGPPNQWSREEILANVVQKYALTQLNASTFDRHSIMLYHFPGALIVGGQGTPENTDLSEMDRSFIAEWYPRRRSQRSAG